MSSTRKLMTTGSSWNSMTEVECTGRSSAFSHLQSLSFVLDFLLRLPISFFNDYDDTNLILRIFYVRTSCSFIHDQE